jgi:hypothetical protein
MLSSLFENENKFSIKEPFWTYFYAWKLVSFSILPFRQTPHLRPNYTFNKNTLIFYSDAVSNLNFAAKQFNLAELK